MKYLRKIGLGLKYVFAVCFCACESFVTITPPESQIVSSTVFDDWTTANAAMTAIYPQIASSNKTIQDFVGLYGDEFNTNTTTGLIRACYENAFDELTNPPALVWNSLYKIIYQANAVIEGCKASVGLNEQQRRQLIGEATFVRAFMNFYLTGLYGEIPLVLTTNYKTNSILSREPMARVFDQIIMDLNLAESSLGVEYIDGSGNIGSAERVRPNKYACRALLARVYLYNHTFDLAEQMASSIIDEVSIYDTVSLPEVFLKNNGEAIWQIPPSSNGPIYATPDFHYFIDSNNPQLYLSEDLVSSFHSSDMRKKSWMGQYTTSDGSETVNFFYPHKYKKYTNGDNTPIITEYYTVFRLAEQYLIRAEARALNGNISGALQDLNIVRKRAGLAPIEEGTALDLSTIILNERKWEFFCEWGHRWFDLKRSSAVNDVMTVVTTQKGGQWETYKTLWPIQRVEIDRNPKLSQNPGYGSISNKM